MVESIVAMEDGMGWRWGCGGRGRWRAGGEEEGRRRDVVKEVFKHGTQAHYLEGRRPRPDRVAGFSCGISNVFGRAAAGDEGGVPRRRSHGRRERLMEWRLHTS